MADAVHTIQISMDAAGHVSVSGPLENKVLMYGLLELAKEVIVEYNLNKQVERMKTESTAYASGESTEKPVPKTLPFGRSVS